MGQFQTARRTRLRDLLVGRSPRPTISHPILRMTHPPESAPAAFPALDVPGRLEYLRLAEETVGVSRCDVQCAGTVGTRWFPKLRTMADDPMAPMHDPAPKARDYRDALGLSVGDLTLSTLDHAEARAQLRERARRLGALIGTRLSEQGLRKGQWPWEPSGVGASEMAFAAFELAGGNCVELMIKWDATSGAHFEFKAYPHRRRPNNPHLYAGFASIELLVPWAADDREVVERFLHLVGAVQETYPR